MKAGGPVTFRSTPSSPLKEAKEQFRQWLEAAHDGDDLALKLQKTGESNEDLEKRRIRKVEAANEARAKHSVNFALPQAIDSGGQLPVCIDTTSISGATQGLDQLCEHLRTLSWPDLQPSEVRPAPTAHKQSLPQHISDDAGLNALVSHAALTKEQLLHWLPARGVLDVQTLMETQIGRPMSTDIAIGAQYQLDAGLEIPQADSGLDSDSLSMQLAELERRIQQEEELQRLSRLEHAWHLAEQQQQPQFRNVCRVFSDLTNAHDELSIKADNLQLRCEAEDRASEQLSAELARLKAALSTCNVPLDCSEFALGGADVINTFLEGLDSSSSRTPSLVKFRKPHRLPNKVGAGPLPQPWQTATSVSTAASDIDLLFPTHAMNGAVGSWQAQNFKDFVLQSTPPILPRSPKAADGQDSTTSLGLWLPSGPWRPAYSGQLIEPACSTELPRRREPKPPAERPPGSPERSPNPRARQFQAHEPESPCSMSVLMSALTPCLEVVTVSDGPAGAIALNWGHNNIDHLSVSRVEVRVWQVDAATLVNFLFSNDDVGISVYTQDLESSSLAVVGVPSSQVKERTTPQDDEQVSRQLHPAVVYSKELLCQKVIPAHLGTADEPAPIVIEGVPSFLPVVVRVRLIAAHTTPRQSTGWGQPVVVVNLGAGLHAKGANTAAALGATLEGVVADEISNMTIKAWR